MTPAQRTPRKAVEDRICHEVAINFNTFGGGRTAGAEWNPVVAALADSPPMFAAGVDVLEVVKFVLARFEVRELPAARQRRGKA